MNILLVYPQMPSTFWTMDHLMKMVGKKSSYPPLGLLTVAALLPEGWEKRLVDLNAEKLAESDLAWADMVFVGAMNVQTASAREVIERCRDAGVKIVAGGPLFTHEHERFEGVDHFVLNEAELTLPPFLADLEAGHPRPIYRSSEFADVHETPTPLWDLADMSRYAYAIIQYSRGCPYQCDFCDVTALFGRRPRTKTAEQIIAELESLGDLSTYDMVLFADDNLIGNRKKLKTELLPALIEWRKRTNPPVGFATQLTINLADDPEMMQLMLEAGFRHVFVGIETPSEESLLNCKKHQNAKRSLIDNVWALQSAGFIVTAGFIVGFDTDTPAIFQNQVDFIQDSGIVIATMNILKAPPGTDLHDRLEQEGRLVGDFDFDENRTNIIPVMDAHVLYEGFEYVLRHVYSPQSVYERVKTFMDGYGGANVESPLSKDLQVRDVAAFLRILYHIGIVGKERRYFWKLLAWTLRHHPKRIEFALLFTALIYQFNKMYERYRSMPPVEPPTRAQMERRVDASTLVRLPVVTPAMAG